MLCPPGLDIHFIHVKPHQPPSGCTPKPLLMVHGWPGSFYEFYKIIPLLTDPRNHGLSEEHIFEVICPSIPGYGFSEASSKKGTGAAGGQVFPQAGSRQGQLPSDPGGPDGQRPFWGSAGCRGQGMGRAAQSPGQPTGSRASRTSRCGPSPPCPCCVAVPSPSLSATQMPRLPAGRWPCRRGAPGLLLLSREPL